jgi:hypothetical protein
MDSPEPFGQSLPQKKFHAHEHDILASGSGCGVPENVEYAADIFVSDSFGQCNFAPEPFEGARMAD